MAASPTAPVTPRPKADWEAIERDYRTGMFSDAELSRKYGSLVTPQAIGKRARAKGWSKDLTAAVRQATRAGLIVEAAQKKFREQVSAGVSVSVSETADTVLAAAELSKQVILQHRTDIDRLRRLTMNLTGELEKVTIAPEKIEELLFIIGEGSELTAAQLSDAHAAHAELMRLPARILSAQRLSQAIARVQELERKAFNLDDDGPDPTKGIEAFLAELDEQDAAGNP